jgi:hypothetical protein
MKPKVNFRVHMMLPVGHCPNYRNQFCIFSSRVLLQKEVFMIWCYHLLWGSECNVQWGTKRQCQYYYCGVISSIINYLFAFWPTELEWHFFVFPYFRLTRQHGICTSRAAALGRGRSGNAAHLSCLRVLLWHRPMRGTWPVLRRRGWLRWQVWRAEILLAWVRLCIHC